MTPKQVSALETSLTPTTERPTKPGWYWYDDPQGPRFVDLFRVAGSAMYVAEYEEPLLSDKAYDAGTWTGPNNLASMLQAIGQWRSDVDEGMEKNERLLDETIELANEVERLEGQRDFLMRGLQDMQNRLGELRGRAAEYRIYRAPVEATEQAGGDKETPTNEQQVAIKRVQLYGNLLSACDKSQADRAAKAGKGSDR